MIFKTTPYPHQLETFKQTKDREWYAIQWEMGAGKTKLAIDTAAHLYLEGKIDAMLVVAPNGVHRNWVSDELPVHCAVDYDACVYVTSKAKTKWHKHAVIDLLESDKLAVLAVPYSGFISQHTKDAVWKFLKKRRVLYVLDEAHFIKTPSAKRTKSIVASAKYAPYRRTLTGTPYLNSPFDLYPQMKFLHLDFWKEHGLPNLSTFKAHFSIQKDVEINGSRFKQVVAYRNEDELRDLLAPHRSRITTEEALPDLPERSYVRVPVELTKQQSKLYEAITDEYLDAFEAYRDASDRTMLDPPPDPLTTLLRLQQVVCGYYPNEDGDIEPLEGTNPRLRAAVELCDATDHQVLIWARFSADVENLLEALGSDRAMRYDGRVDEDAKVAALDAFRAGEVQVLVLNPQAGGTGLTLNEARTTIYYSNSFSLGDRLQSERRNHRSGQKNAVTYYDLIAEGTIDEKIVGSLRNKIDAAATVNGDELSSWLGGSPAGASR